MTPAAKARKSPFFLLRLFPGYGALARNPLYLRLSGRGWPRRRWRLRPGALEFRSPKGRPLAFSLGRLPVALLAPLAFLLRGSDLLVWMAMAFAYSQSIWGPWERKTLRFITNAAGEAWGGELCLTALDAADYGRAMFAALWEREAIAVARLLAVCWAATLPYWAWVFAGGWDLAGGAPGEGLSAKALQFLGAAILWLALWSEVLQAAALNLTLALQGDPGREFRAGLERDLADVSMGTLIYVALRLPGLLAVAAWSLAEISTDRALPTRHAAFNGPLALLAFSLINWLPTVLILGEIQEAHAEDFGKGLNERVREG